MHVVWIFSLPGLSTPSPIILDQTQSMAFVNLHNQVVAESAARFVMKESIGDILLETTARSEMAETREQPKKRKQTRPPQRDPKSHKRTNMDSSVN